MKADTPLRSIGQDRFDPSCLQSSVKYIQQRCKCRRGKASKHAAPGPTVRRKLPQIQETRLGMGRGFMKRSSEAWRCTAAINDKE